MCAAARALAGAMPDDYSRRVAARGVFLHLAEFIRWARRARNQVPANKTNAEALKDLKERLNQLATADWGPYAPLRDRVAAHRQPIGGKPGVVAWEAANRLWREIDAPLVGVLVDDVLGIWVDLAPVCGLTPVAPPTVPTAIRSSLSRALAVSSEEGVRVGVGSFDETRPGFLSAVQGGPLGDRLREIADTIEHFGHLVAVLDAVQEDVQSARLVRGGLVIEVCGLVELVFEVPKGRAAATYYPPLVDLLGPPQPGAEELAAARVNLDRTAVSRLRQVRDTIAAHVDDKGHLADLVQQLDELDPAVLQSVWDYADHALVGAAAPPGSVIRPLTMRSTVLRGLERLDEPEFGRPYGTHDPT